MIENSEKDKKHLVMLWHKLEPWNDSCLGVNEINKNLLHGYKKVIEDLQDRLNKVNVR